MLLGIPSVALASNHQVAILQDDTNVLQNPGLTLAEMRHLGVEMVRVTVRWSYIAPSGGSRHRPSFNAADPNAYPARNWAPYDAIVRNADADGIKVLFVLSGFAPLWAQGPNPGRFAAKYNQRFKKRRGDFAPAHRDADGLEHLPRFDFQFGGGSSQCGIQAVVTEFRRRKNLARFA